MDRTLRHFHDTHGSSPPTMYNDPLDWSPFKDRLPFEFAELIFEKMQSSAGDVDQLLKILVARNVLQKTEDWLFENHDHLLQTIDNIQVGEAPWGSFSIQYDGPSTDNSSISWQNQTYTVHTRDVHTVVRNMLVNAEFCNCFDYATYREYMGPHSCRYSNFMSGEWAYKQSVSHKSYFCSYYNFSDLYRTLLHLIQQRMVQCLFPSSLVQTRQPCQSQLATQSFTQYMCLLAMCTMLYERHMVTH